MSSNDLQLQGKIRNIGDEAPAIRVKMCDGSIKVIGMMADKVQMILTLSSFELLSKVLIELINEYNSQANIYILGSSKPELIDLDNGIISSDFEKFSLKYGVNIDESTCANSVFIINKDGEIVYKDVLGSLRDQFDFEKLKNQLQSAIEFKKKGHVHEDWMSA